MLCANALGPEDPPANPTSYVTVDGRTAFRAVVSLSVPRAPASWSCDMKTTYPGKRQSFPGRDKTRKLTWQAGLAG